MMFSNCWVFIKRAAAAAKAEIKHHNTERAHEMNSEYANKRVKEPAIKSNDLDKEPYYFEKAMIKINELNKDPSYSEKAMIIIDGLADYPPKKQKERKMNDGKKSSFITKHAPEYIPEEIKITLPKDLDIVARKSAKLRGIKVEDFIKICVYEKFNHGE